jgi:hypothetical protein
MKRTAARTAVALCLAVLATGVPRASAERTVAACACHHAGGGACSCAARSHGAGLTGRARCVSPCCRVPETARAPQGGPEPFLLAARAAPLPPPARRPSFLPTPASALDREREPETPPPRRA